MTSLKKSSRKKKTTRQFEEEQSRGKIRYRIRKQMEKDGEKQVKEFKHVL